MKNSILIGNIIANSSITAIGKKEFLLRLQELMKKYKVHKVDIGWEKKFS